MIRIPGMVVTISLIGKLKIIPVMGIRLKIFLKKIQFFLFLDILQNYKIK